MPKKIILSTIKWVSYSVILVIFVTGATLAISYLNGTYPPEVQAAESAARVGQIHLQQESVMKFYKDTIQEKPSMIVPSGPDTVIIKGESIEVGDAFQEEFVVIIPSASDAINVSTTVLDNLSLHMEDSQPIYATNWLYGATLYHENIDSNTIIYTVTADY